MGREDVPGGLGQGAIGVSRLSADGSSPAGDPFEELSERELSVLRMMSGDLTQREIGDHLFISFNTVKTHSRSIYRKLGVTRRTDAVARARQLGIV
ncbi:MAG: response regulator transcription factor [Thermomicrobiales bacterium]|nr:response regulator transcription factor [Thermomicrobiales bacterium]